MKASRFFSQGLLFTLLVLLSFNIYSATPYDMGSPTFTNLYVSTTGNDNNNGLSQSTALRTIRGAWSKIQSSGFSSTGYKVNFLPGSYYSDLYLDFVNASYEKPVLFTAANGPGTVTFNGNIQFYQVSYIYITDINISNPGDVYHCDTCDHVLLRNMVMNGGNRQAHETVKVNQSQHVYIENCDIQGANDNPVDFVAVQYGHMINNKIHNGEDWCAYVKGGSAYFTIEGNEFYNCGTGGFTTGQGTGFEYMMYPWITYEAMNVKVINNIVHDVQGAAFGVNGGYNILIAHNTAYRVGTRSHVLEFVYGGQECDGDSALPGKCQENLSLGGWGSLSASSVINIPNKNVFVYNNIVYNPAGVQSLWQHLQVDGPRTNPASSHIPNVVADQNLQIRGNIIWNGNSSMPLGVGGNSCGDNNPTCNEAQLLSENKFNNLQPQLVNPAGGNFHPVEGGNVFAYSGFEIPDFDSNDIPPLNAPQENLMNNVLLDRDGAARNSSLIAGAYGPGGPIAPSADISVSVSDSPDPVVSGNQVTYTINLNNAGPSSAENFIVSGNLAGATVLSATSSQANCAINTNGYSCNFGTFAPGSASISVLGQTTSAGNLDFTVSTSTSTTDSNSTNNSDTERTTVSGDSDGDGVLDASDNCPTVSNANQADNDGDRSGDVCDSDDDNDGIADTTDNCPLASNANQADLDADRIGDVCDTDLDGDGRANTSDNCSRVSNADQADGDGDGIGNVCDNCPTVSNANQADANANGIGDACEVNSRDLIAVIWRTQPTQSCTGSGTSLSCTVTGTLSVKNQASTALSTAFRMRYYLSSDGNLDSSDFLLREKSSGTFTANQTKNIAFSRTLSTGQSAAGKLVIGVVDATSLIAESNENNNRLASASIGGTPPPPPPPSTFVASGKVIDSASAGVSGVNLNFSVISGTATAPAAVTSDSNGNFSASGFVSGSTYRVTPSKSSTTFSPSSLDFSAASSTLNFTATAVVTPPPPSPSDVIPVINEAMKQRINSILASGTRNKGAFAKIGDSITESGSFLVDIGCNGYELGSYTALESTIQYYQSSTFNELSPTWCGGRGNSFNRASTSAEAGWTTNSALANGACGESNFRCEIKATNAGFAFVMYGTNDLERYNDINMFKTNLSRIVSESIALGTVPILSTIPPRLDSTTMGSRVATYNQAIQEVAATYQIPVVNFWQALQNLGATNHYGMDPDGVHPNVYQGSNAAVFTSAAMKYGYNVRNLSTLQMFEKIKRIVIDNGAADSSL